MSSSASSSSDSDVLPPGQPSNGRGLQTHDDVSNSTSDYDSESSSGAGTGEDDSSDVPGEVVEEEATVLSHAEKRRQKRKERKIEAEPQSDASKSKPAKVKNTAELKPSKIPKRQNSIWVGNLSFKTTPDSLRKFFDGVGEITRVHMPMKLADSGPGGKGAVKENRGFAYVDFATPDAKTIAITLSENPLDGRRLLIKDGDNFAGRPSTSQSGASEAVAAESSGTSKTAQKILRSQKQPPGPTLFLGNLGFETTERSIREMLSSHRKKLKGDDLSSEEKDKWIRKVRMGTFEDSGKCKGWAFVDFTSTEHATAAVTNPQNYFLDGRKLVVEYASPEAVRRGGGAPRDKKGEKQKATDAHAHADAGVNAEIEEDSKTQKRRGERVRPARKRTADGNGDHHDSAPPAKKRKVDESGSAPHQGKPSGHRTKPGAALAMAKRETVSIAPSQGTKIVF